MRTYDARDWYWTVGGDATQVYSSASGNYVLVSNAAYVAWKADGTLPTKIDTEANLGAVLSAYSLRPVAANVLDGFQDENAKTIVATALFKIVFNHENRLRAIERNLGLNGSPANLTQGQAKAAVKALM